MLKLNISHKGPIAVATQFKAWACGRLLTGIAGSNPEVSMEVCRECCVHLIRGYCVGRITCPENTLAIVVFLSVISKPQQFGKLRPTVALESCRKKKPQINPTSLWTTRRTFTKLTQSSTDCRLLTLSVGGKKFRHAHKCPLHIYNDGHFPCLICLCGKN